MAIQNFIDGALYGKIGGFVGANWRGIDYMRSYAKPKQPDSPAQVEHKRRFRILITIANNLNSVWFPYAFTPVQNKTLSNQFMSLNKDFYHESSYDTLFKMPYKFQAKSSNVGSVLRRGTYATARVTDNHTEQTGKTIRALFGYHFPEDNLFFFKVTESVPFSWTWQFPQDLTGHKFYIFVQNQYENGLSQVWRGATLNWADYN